MPDPGWVSDPSGRYHQRFFDGTRWTEHVADEYGRRGVDPIDLSAAGHAGATPGTPAVVAPGSGSQTGTASTAGSTNEVGALGTGAVVACVGALIAVICTLGFNWISGDGGGFRLRRLPRFAGTNGIDAIFCDSGNELILATSAFVAAIALAARSAVARWVAAGVAIVVALVAVAGTLIGIGNSGVIGATGADINPSLGMVGGVVGLVVAAVGMVLSARD